MSSTNASITICAFLYSIENMGGSSLFKQLAAKNETEDELLKFIYEDYFAIYGPAVALCYNTYHGLAIPTAHGEESIAGAFNIFCKLFNLNEDLIIAYGETEILILLNNLFTFTGEQANYERPGLDPEILKLMEIWPMGRSDEKYRRYFLK